MINDFERKMIRDVSYTYYIQIFQNISLFRLELSIQ